MRKAKWLVVILAALVTGYAVGYFVKTPEGSAWMSAAEARTVGALAAWTWGSRPQPATTADRQAYWFSRYNTTFLGMMSGMGPALPETQRLPGGKGTILANQLGPFVGFDPAKAPTNPSCLQAVYASGDPHFVRAMDLKDWATMRWDPAKMDRTLVPAAQAFYILKAAAKGANLDYHELPFERFAALVRLRQAKGLAELLATELVDDRGLFVSKSPAGRKGEPQPLDQIAALWAFSRLALAAADPTLPLYEKLLGDPGRYRAWAAQAFQAVRRLPPRTPMELALAIEAAGWYPAASGEGQELQAARGLIEDAGRRLRESTPTTAGDLAFSIYGLMEAGRVTRDPAYGREAWRRFGKDLEALWDEKAGVYATEAGTGKYVYDPYRVGGVLAALNALRFLGTPDNYFDVREARPLGSPHLVDARYARFFDTMFIRSGLLPATGVDIVPVKYKEREPLLHFTHPALPLPPAAGGKFGRAPVFATEVTYESGAWRVTNPRFTTAPGMFLAHMLVWIHRAEPDIFVPHQGLARSLQARARG